MGGGGQQMPPPPDYEAESRAQINLERERAAIAEQQAQRQREEQAIKEAEARRAFDSKRQQAKESALGYGRTQLQAKGMDADPYNIMSLYTSNLDRAYNSIPDLDPNPGGYLGTSIWDDAYGTARSTQRNKLNADANQFIGSGFESELLADTLDDPYLEAILGRQYNDALGSLQGARSRGQLNDTGYSRAINDLNTAKTRARGDLDDIGMGVIQTGRDTLSNQAKNIRSGIQNFDFNDGFDLDRERSALLGKATSAKGRLEGDIYRGLGDRELFDISSLIGKAASKSGVSNTGTGLYNAFSNQQSNEDRTTSTTGAF